MNMTIDKNSKESLSSGIVGEPFTTAIKRPTIDHYMHDPAMTVFPDGTIIVAAPSLEFAAQSDSRSRRERGGREIVGTEILVSRSCDGGCTWEALSSLPYRDATLFVHDNRLYMFISAGPYSNEFQLTWSGDKGSSWSKPVTLFSELYWNCSTAIVVTDNKLYWPVGDTSHSKLAVICGDLSQDLMDPSAWNVSNWVEFPGIPERLRSNLYPPEKKIWPIQWSGDIWLEPNMVNVNGHLRVLARCTIDEYATSNICGICDLTENDDGMELKFTQFHSLPGGQNKFYIMYDEESKLFWMLSNMPTDSQGAFYKRDELLDIGFHGGPGNERRFLMLYYSRDALNWFGAGCVAKWGSPIQAFMYPSAAIYKDDILFISRTSKDAQNQHDADLVTFHRIKNFRSLAMNIFPEL